MSSSKRILITGADGFIGKHIKDALNAFGEIYTYSRRESQDPFHLSGDICSIDGLNLNFDIIIHAAGNKTDEATMQQVNVEGTKAVVRFAKKINAKLIAIGSGGIYGIYRNSDSIITTQSAYCPENAYELSKAQAQEAIENSEMPVASYVILQPTNVIGEGDSTKKLLNLMHTVQKKKFFYLNKKARVNYVYVKKIVSVVQQIIDKQHYTNSSFLINDPLTIEELVQMISTEIGSSVPRRSLPKAIQPLLFLLAKLTPYLPSSMQKFTLGKYYEMTSEKYYSTENTDLHFPTDKTVDIRHGIHNLVAYYRDNQWL